MANTMPMYASSGGEGGRDQGDNFPVSEILVAIQKFQRIGVNKATPIICGVKNFKLLF